MPPNQGDLIAILLSFFLPFLIVLLIMPHYIRFLVTKNYVVEDAHKMNSPKVPSPAGPLLVLAIIISEIILFLYYNSVVPITIAIVVLITFLIGLFDDLYVLGGAIKPILLISASLPIIIAKQFDPSVYIPKLYFPVAGATGEHFTIYTILLIASMPIVANAYNMMDAFNGEISGFTLLTSLALLFGIVIKSMVLSNYSPMHIAITLPLTATSLAFYLFNRYPSRIFDGDSGSLSFGAMYASIAVIGGVEFAAVVAMIPAILNSFYILSSVRGLVERRRIQRPTYIGKDGLLYASTDPSAPTTLARMILVSGPLDERRLVLAILTLTAFSCILSSFTSLLTWVSL